ncbi:MAG: hypothetical protein KatS3mg129_2486 [Leptospiraceae bacterium]|nr:MAG: hypothetical protein KatS3mg129_2486 [Leptospiraceae bacterium]
MKVLRLIFFYFIMFSISLNAYDFILKGLYIKNNLFMKTGISLNDKFNIYYGIDKNNQKEDKINASYNIQYDYYGENFIDSIEGIDIGYLILKQKKEINPMQFINLEYRFITFMKSINFYGNLYFIRSEDKVISNRHIFFRLSNISNLDFYSYKIYYYPVYTLGIGFGSDYQFANKYFIGAEFFYYKLPKIEYRFDIFVDKMDYFYYKELYNKIFTSLSYDYDVAMITLLNNMNFFNEFKKEEQYLKLRLYIGIKF